MEFNYQYAGSSKVAQGEGDSAMSFVPDALRPPTYFKGRVHKTLAFREAMSALHDVVVSDLRFKPKDRTKYLAWRAQQDDVDLVALTRDRAAVAKQIADVQAELAPLEAAAQAARRPFYDARARYWRYIYERDRELWFKLDPVITVHPDQVFFECFSRDESSYGRLAASYEAFDQLGERANGTTNVDYSDGLYSEFQKLRTYKHTSFEIDPSGFDVKTSGEEGRREVKIDVPDSWVRGFLQVSSAMTLPTTSFDLHPMDLHNVCMVLRRNKELIGPRSLRYRLLPGQPVVIVIEPWNIEVVCPRSIYHGPSLFEARVWGRRRLHILERLLPRANKIRVHLLGSGQPSFYVVDLGELSFTLGLSGWTHANWSAEGNFDLMAAREDVTEDVKARVFDELGKQWLATPAAIGKTLGLDPTHVASALGIWTQNGRAMYDLERGVYRKRELARDPLPMEKLRFASEREASAARILHRGKVSVDDVSTRDANTRIAGRIQLSGRLSTTSLVLDPDRRLVEGECTCDYYIRNRMHRGPCDHMLALRAAHKRGISDRDLGTITKVEGAPAARTPPSPGAPPPSTFPARPTPPPARAPEAPPPSRTAFPLADGQLRAALAALGDRIVVRDEARLLAELTAVYVNAESGNARLFALVAAFKGSPHVAQLPSDQVLIEALRAHVQAPLARPAPAPLQKKQGLGSPIIWLVLVSLLVRLILALLRGK